MWLIVVLAIAGPAALCLLLTPLVRSVAPRVGFVDQPGGHKGHGRPVALGGGVAIFATLLITLLGGVVAARIVLAAGAENLVPEMLRPHLPGIAGKLPMVLAILGGALVLHIVGLLDDRRSLPALPRLLIEIAVAAVLVVGFGIRAAEALGPAASIAITIVWIVLIINAFNFLDNMDGLSAGVAAITASIFASSAMVSGQIFVPVMAWVLVGTMLGFLAFNFSPASIFMGDAGSMVIGYFLAILSVVTTFYDPGQSLSPAGVLVPPIVLAVPLYDVVSVCVHRIRAGESPFKGDRRHFSHRLVRRGMSVRAAVMTIYLATAATSISAVILPHADTATAALVFAQTLCIVLIIAVLEGVGTGRRMKDEG